MGRNLYVGNLSFGTSEQELGEMFSSIGVPDSVFLVKDRETGRSRGFAFVEMATDEDAQQAIARLDGSEFDGRSLTVNEARPREERSNNGGGSRDRQRRDRY